MIYFPCYQVSTREQHLKPLPVGNWEQLDYTHYGHQLVFIFFFKSSSVESILPEIWLIGKGRFFFNSSNSSTKVEALQVALERRFNCNTKLKRYLRHAKLTLKNATPFLLSWLPPGWIFHQYEAFPNRPSEKDEFGNADLVDRKNYKNRAL